MAVSDGLESSYPVSLGVEMDDGVGHLVQLFVGQGDAPVRPVEPLSDKRQPTQPVTLAVDHYGPAGINAALGGRLLICVVRIRNMYCSVEGTIRFLKVERVVSLRRSFIPFLLFVTFGIGAKSD